MHRFLFILPVAVVLFTSSNVDAQTPTGKNVKDESYQVYDAAINKMFAGDKVAFDSQTKIKKIVIRENTNTDYAYWEKKENWQKVKDRLPGLSDEIIADYEARLKPSTLLKQRFNLNLKYSLLSNNSYKSIFGDDLNANSTVNKWSHFYKRYPDSGGYIWLSNVGFNKTRDRALLFLVHWCGTLCGTGHYILMSKKSASWNVDRVGMMWVS